jgi:hypothetical protein
VRSYTLPGTEPATHFPFGVGDMIDIGPSFDRSAFGAIPFWVGVGGADTNAADTARAFDGLEGQTRADRARAFASALDRLGDPVELQVVGGAGHEETAAVRNNACASLGEHVAQ